MNLTHIKPLCASLRLPLRVLAGIVVGAALLASIAPSAQATPNASEEMRQEWARHHQAMFKAHLDQMAERLEIKSSQQAAWQAFAKAAMPPPMNPQGLKPGSETEMDAATIARRRADMAAMHAQHLAQVADATAKLQEVLTPDQRKVFDQMTRKFDHHGHMGPHHERHGDGDGEDHHSGHPHD